MSENNVTELAPVGNHITLTYEALNSRVFVGAIQRLAESKALPVATKIKVGKFKDALVKASVEAQTEWKKHLDEKVEWEGEGDDKKPKSDAQYREVETQFLKISVALGVKKFDASNLKLALNDFTSDEICALEPVIAGFESLAQEGEE